MSQLGEAEGTKARGLNTLQMVLPAYLHNEEALRPCAHVVAEVVGHAVNEDRHRHTRRRRKLPRHRHSLIQRLRLRVPFQKMSTQDGQALAGHTFWELSLLL